MNTVTASPAGEIRVLRSPLDDSLAGALALQRLAEATHLPTGVASEQFEVEDVPAAGSTAIYTATGSDALLHVAAGELRVQWGPELDRNLTARCGDTLVVPAGVTFRAINASRTAPSRFIVVRGA